MVWHIWSFFCVTVDGILLAILANHSADNPRLFYAAYLSLLSLLIGCEFPFIFILTRLVSQAIQTIKREAHLLETLTEDDEQDRIIESALAGSDGTYSESGRKSQSRQSIDTINTSVRGEEDQLVLRVEQELP